MKSILAFSQYKKSHFDSKTFFKCKEIFFAFHETLFDLFQSPNFDDKTVFFALNFNCVSDSQVIQKNVEKDFFEKK